MMYTIFYSYQFTVTVGCVFLSLHLVEGRFERNRRCSPPRGNICIEVNKCPYFITLLETTPIPRPPLVIKILRENHCGFQRDMPKVCCTISTEQIPLETFVEPSDVSNHPNLHLLPRNKCGVNSVLSQNLRITSGSKTGILEFPWMALLAFHTNSGIEFKCGGSIINQQYVLTAAHCVLNFDLAGVRLGEHNINTEKDCNAFGYCAPHVQDFNVENVIVHENYQPETNKNDIALIRLATPANFTYENIKPICLPVGKSERRMNLKFAIVAGWGVTESGYRSAELLKVSLPIVRNEDCRKLGKNYSPVTYQQICAGGHLGKDSCGGDSGSPLKHPVPINGLTRFVQYGIVSYGPARCGARRQPGVYTNVVYYVKWILNNLKPPLD